MKLLYLLMTVLKFMGITILILLVLLLSLLIIILTVPIKYKIDINKSEEIYSHTKIKWLYSALSMDILYNSNDKSQIKYKILGIPLKSRKKRINKEESSTRKELETDTKPKVKSNKSNQVDTTTKKAKKPHNKKEKSNSLISQIRAYSYKKELLTDTIDSVKEIFKSIGPKYLDIYIELGKEDPADTGYIMAVLSALYPFYYSFADIAGNYEKECLYVKIKANGKIVLGKLIYQLIKYIKNKSVRELIKVLRDK